VKAKASHNVQQQAKRDLTIRETVLVQESSKQRRVVESALDAPEGMPALRISLDQDERTSLDATQYGQFSAHLSSYRNVHYINQERLPGEKAVSPSANPTQRPLQPEGQNSSSLKAEPEAAQEDSFQLGGTQLKTELACDADGEVHYQERMTKSQIQSGILIESNAETLVDKSEG
jgi:hypothetical protein